MSHRQRFPHFVEQRGLADYLYLHLLARKPTQAEKRIALGMLGAQAPSRAGVEDLFWALLVSPEFQFVH